MNQSTTIFSCYICGKDVPKPKYYLSPTILAKKPCPECRSDIYRRNGRSKAELNSQIIITPEMKQVILGSIIGDGYISVSPKSSRMKNPGSSLAVTHGCSQREYALWKASKLGDLISNIDDYNKKCGFRTKTHAYFVELRKQFYPNGIKIITTENVADLGLLGYAIWYLDDGSFSPAKRYTTQSINRQFTSLKKDGIKFSTCGFTDIENEILIDKIERTFNVSASLVHKRSRKNKIGPYKIYPSIIVYGNQCWNILDAIKPFILDAGMNYKLGEGYNAELRKAHFENEKEIFKRRLQKLLSEEAIEYFSDDELKQIIQRQLNIENS